MRTLLFLVFSVAVLLRAQQTPQGSTEKDQQTSSAPTDSEAAEKAQQREMQELAHSLQEGNSPNDYIRALEAHIARYPNSSRLVDIEKLLAKSAIEAHDDKRLIQYGIKVLDREPEDLTLLDRVSRAFLNTDSKESYQKALEYAQRYETVVRNSRSRPAPGRMSAGQWSDELDHAEGRALALQARASGKMGNIKPAIDLAARAWKAYPTAEAAREWAKWLNEGGDSAGAVQHYAWAFTIEDPRSTATERAKDRALMGEIYSKTHGSEKGLGDVVLAAYDLTRTAVDERVEKLKEIDPNVQASKILDFTLPGANGKDLPLSTLKGKTVVFDFWATWCGPCKAQRPLYQKVEEKFKNDSSVVFLSVNTDEDRSVVGPFLKAQNWNQPVYYDGGLTDYLKVSSIPTTLVLDGNGRVVSRMNGFIPDRFVELLTARIKETTGETRP